MASRTFNQFQGTLQKGVVTLYAKLLSNGADPTVPSGDLKVVTSEVINALTSPVTINPSNGFVEETITPSSSKYVIKLQDPYVRLLNVTVNEIVDVGGAQTAPSAVVWVDDVNNQTSPSLTVQFGSGDVTTNTLLLAVTLANSTAL